MCGRFDLHSTTAIIAREFSTDSSFVEIEPRYNIAPSQHIVIIRRKGANVIDMCRWGFIPAWAKEEKTGYRMINARADSVQIKPAFKDAFRGQRCLIVADGFYEWKHVRGRKIPFYVRMKSRMPFGFAGLFNLWAPREGDSFCTSTIITTYANDLLSVVHDRMPAIIPPESYDVWLDADFADQQVLMGLLAPYPSDRMEMFEVSPRVNSPAYDSEDAIKPWRDDQ